MALTKTQMVLGLVGLAVVAAFVGTSISFATRPDIKAAVEADKAAEASSSAAALTWNYRMQSDPMTGKAVYFAELRSETVLDLDFPYKGPQSPRLTLRRHPKSGVDVLVVLDQGQTLCRSYGETCKLEVRFDDAPSETFRAMGPSDGDTDMIFLSDPRGFIEKMQNAKRVLIQIPLYQNGSPVLEYKTEGYKDDVALILKTK